MVELDSCGSIRAISSSARWGDSAGTCSTSTDPYPSAVSWTQNTTSSGSRPAAATTEATYASALSHPMSAGRAEPTLTEVSTSTAELATVAGSWSVQVSVPSGALSLSGSSRPCGRVVLELGLGLGLLLALRAGELVGLLLLLGAGELVGLLDMLGVGELLGLLLLLALGVGELLGLLLTLGVGELLGLLLTLGVGLGLGLELVLGVGDGDGRLGTTASDTNEISIAPCRVSLVESVRAPRARIPDPKLISVLSSRP